MAALRSELDGRTVRLRDGRSFLSPTGRLLRFARPPAGVPHQLVAAGSAHPLPGPVPADDVTVVVPVHNRLPALERCLAALTGRDVIVVDDGSADPLAVEDLAPDARIVRRPNGGPAAARNSALPLLHKQFVAFLDSDCVPPADWLELLRGHFADPRVGAVAPRVTGGLRSPLDLGCRPADVRPGAHVAYVPTAALVVRRAALTRFDEALRYGEDVDLVWRMVEQGWTIRYDPRVEVRHEEPAQLSDRLARRFRYGTSAAPLSRRHPGAVTHLVLPPWPTAAVVALLVGRPLVAAGAAAVTYQRLQRHLHDPGASARVTGRAVSGTAQGLGRALAMTGPLAWAAGWRRPQLLGLMALPLVLEQLERRPGADPFRYVGEGLLEQAAYGAGVVAGCVRERTWRPLVPRLRASER
ncbi:MAG: glycosyl transferase family 2 [Frankiales bacterium]|nr:glycosyl transferase family 2 [Frankiales bacterium]